MKHTALIWWMLAVLVLSLGLVEYGDTLIQAGANHQVLDEDTGEMVPQPYASLWGQTLHARAEWLMAASLVLLFFGLVDLILFPRLRLVDVIFGEGEWGKSGEDYVRAAIIVWHGIVAAALLLTVT